MGASDNNSNRFFWAIVANSSLTPKQISIISNRLHAGARPPDMTSGAYFTQVRQCREKIHAVLYSAVLLQSTGALEPQALAALSQVSDQLGVIFATGSRDILHAERTESVMSVISQLIKRVSRL